MSDDFEKIALSFKALSDPTRLQILRILESGERSVNEIVDFFTLSQPTISRHLSALVNVGLIKARKSEQQKFFRLNNPTMAELLELYFGQFDIFSGINFRAKLKSV
jgi:DNA-binding transcriptional ArsR family regulator